MAVKLPGITWLKILPSIIGGPDWPAIIKQEFTEPCIRHDFGYRNFGKGHLEATVARKNAIDQKLKNDMDAVCATRSGVRKQLCTSAASLALGSVQKFGNSSFFP